MNALWISRMCAYKQTPGALETARRIIEFKVARESAFLSHHGKAPFQMNAGAASSINELLLLEARAAKHFWKSFKELLPEGIGFHGRIPGGRDTANRLLDVGFHHLTGIVRSYLTERDVPSALGFMHVARSSDASPLAYDLVELFRADMVDAEVLRYLHLKKKPIEDVDMHIAHFLHELNERLARPHYVRGFKECLPYRYYMELQTLKLISAVDHKEIFKPIHLPDRHDSRCLTHVNGMLKSQRI